MPRDIRSPPLSAWSTTSLARCSAAIGILPSAQRSPTDWASGSTDLGGERAQPPERELLRHQPLEPLTIEGAHRLEQRGLRRAVERARLRPGQDVLARPGGQVADPLAALDQPGERPQQGDLIGRCRPGTRWAWRRGRTTSYRRSHARSRAAARPVSSATSWISYVRFECGHDRRGLR